MFIKKSNSLKELINLQLFATTVTPAQLYTKIVDEIYSRGTLTAVLDAPASLVKNTMDAKTIHVPVITTDGFHDYDKSTGYGDSNATIGYQSHTFTIDRSASFDIDAADNMETLNTQFTRLSDTFVRTKMIPEVDAYRLSKLASNATPSQIIEENLTKDTAVQSWDTAMESLSNNEVDLERLIAFVTPTFMKFLKQSNLITRQMDVDKKGTTVNRFINILDGVTLIEVPQSRMYTAIELKTGAESGYSKAVGGKDLNYIICDKSSCAGLKKINKMKMITPEDNQLKDAYSFKFRLYHDLFVYDNKKNGVYVSHKTT